MGRIQRIRDILVGQTLLAGMALTAYGLAHLTWPQAVPWSAGGIRNLAIFVVVCVAVAALASFWSKRSPLVVGGVIAIGLALLSGALWPLLVTLWFAFASAILGKSILSTLRINAEENWLTNFLVGAGVYGTAVGLLAHFPVNYPGVYGIALALPVVLWWRNAAKYWRSFIAVLAKNDDSGSKNKWLDAAIVVVAMVHFVVALNGACLPILSAKSNTLTIMANADRIGRSIVINLSGDFT